jgi:hypothetical protein
LYFALSIHGVARMYFFSFDLYFFRLYWETVGEWDGVETVFGGDIFSFFVLLVTGAAA